MFASEHILLNTTVCALELSTLAAGQSKQGDKGCRWAPRDIIFTDRSLYLFAEKPQATPDKVSGREQSLQTADYLHDKYERFDMKMFKAIDPSIKGVPPPYIGDIPQFYKMYNNIVELMNLETRKRRIITCNSRIAALEVICLFNLISAYRQYEQMFIKDGKEGPLFITNWVQNYMEHKGVMVFDSEILNSDNLQSLLCFGKGNDSLKSICFSGEHILLNNEETIDIVHQILNQFNGNSITKITFQATQMSTYQLKQIATSLAAQSSLQHLEITSQNLTGDSLDIISNQIFKENRNIQFVILKENQLGIGKNIKEKISMFLESFLLELKCPKELDISSNQFDDESLYPIVKYIFANHENKTLTNVNLEWNNFSNYSKRTLAVAYSKCPNTNLKCKIGPLPLTQVSLKLATSPNLVQDKEKPETFEIHISRKPADPELGMRYLPLDATSRQTIETYIQKIRELMTNRKKVFVEEIDALLQEISTLEFEFPRHILEPIFILCNEKLQQAIDTNHLYSLEILLNSMSLMGARNMVAEQKYNELTQEASIIARNLMKAINMDNTGQDEQLLKVLVENLQNAKRIGMRGEVIDIATTLKALCTKLLQEMLGRAQKSDEETDDDPEHQMYIIRDEDKRSVFDQKYDEFIGFQSLDQFNLGFSVDLEPNLGFHPYNTDYIKISNLNLNYAKKNMTESRKILYDDEAYPIINVQTRSAFLLSNGGSDASKSLQFSNVRDDTLMFYTRLLFRYRLNLDELFPPSFEPAILDQTTFKLKEDVSQLNMKMEDYKNLASKEDLVNNASPITKPLTKINSAFILTALQISEMLQRMQLTFTTNKDIEAQYKIIRSFFEKFVINKSTLINEAIHDEMFLQLYRQLGAKNINTQTQQKDSYKLMVLVLVLLTRYATPSEQLLQLIFSWLNKTRGDKQTDRLVKMAVQNLKIPRVNEHSGRAYIDWPPSLYEIEAIYKDRKIEVQVLWPSGEHFSYPIDETTTVESLLKSKVWQEGFLRKDPEQVQYWLYTCEDDLNKFPQPLAREKKILKLMYKDEKYQESLIENTNQIVQQLNEARKLTRRQTIVASIQKTSPNTTADADFKFFTLQVRRRIFPSLFHFPTNNFKVLQSASKNFIFHQARLDYVEREILKATLSKENAVLLAAFTLKVKYQTKILRSKENTLSIDLVKKSLETVIPKSMLGQQKPEQWESQIVQSFEQQNMKELSIEETQEQFLLLLGSYEFMFASYFVVSRRKNALNRVGMRASIFQAGAAGANIAVRKKFRDASKEPVKTPKQQKKSRFQESSPSSESESVSDQQKSSESNSDSSKEDDKSDSDEESKEHNQDQQKGLEVFQEYFQSVVNEILLICTQNHIIVMENKKRDKAIMKIKYQDLLYVMGKKEELKIGMIIKGKISQTNETFDCRTELISDGGGARGIAEDILTYCQLHLLEQTLNHSEYCEILKRNAIDGIFAANYDHDYDSGDKQGFDIIIDDDILMGKVNIASTQTKLRTHRDREDFVEKYNDNLNTSQNTIESREELNNSNSSFNKRMSPKEDHEKKIKKNLGYQIKLKQPNFFVYMKKHPIYNSNFNEQSSKIMNSLNQQSSPMKSQSSLEKKQPVQETLKKQNFEQIQHNSLVKSKEAFNSIAEESDDIKSESMDQSSSSSSRSSQQSENEEVKQQQQKVEIEDPPQSKQEEKPIAIPTPPMNLPRGLPRGPPMARGPPRGPALPPARGPPQPPIQQQVEPIQQQVQPPPVKIPSPVNQKIEATATELPKPAINQLPKVETQKVSSPKVAPVQPQNDPVVQTTAIPEPTPVQKINTNSFMAAYQQQTAETEVKVEEKPVVQAAPRPSNIKFEKLNKDDKKAQLKNVMSAFGKPPP